MISYYGLHLTCIEVKYINYIYLNFLNILKYWQQNNERTFWGDINSIIELKQCNVSKCLRFLLPTKTDSLFLCLITGLLITSFYAFYLILSRSFSADVLISNSFLICLTHRHCVRRVQVDDCPDVRSALVEGAVQQEPGLVDSKVGRALLHHISLHVNFDQGGGRDFAVHHS